MPKMQSRRELLTLAVAAAATAPAVGASGGPNRHFVNRFEVGLAPRGEALRAFRFEAP